MICILKVHTHSLYIGNDTVEYKYISWGPAPIYAISISNRTINTVDIIERYGVISNRQQLDCSNNKENIKASPHCHFARGIHQWSMDPLTEVQ